MLLVKPKQTRCAIGYLVTEVTTLLLPFSRGCSAESLKRVVEKPRSYSREAEYGFQLANREAATSIVRRSVRALVVVLSGAVQRSDYKAQAECRVLCRGDRSERRPV